MDRGNSLAVLGIADEEERAYRAIVGRAAMRLGEIAECWSDLASTRAGARALLGRLEALGLVDVLVGQPTLYRAARASEVLEGLALAQEKALLDARAQVVAARARIDALVRLQAGSAENTSPGELLEVIQGRDAVYQRGTSIIRDAVSQVRCIDKPPYANRTDYNREHREDPAEPAQLAAGIQVRAVYDVTSFDVPGKVRSVEDAARLGEQARVMAGAPVKLMIGDDRLALLPFGPSETIESGVVVHPCALLDALIALFESCWQIATPFGGAPAEQAGPVTRDARRILTLMAMGTPDQAIARQLGIGHRTLQKRLSELLAEMEVSTRFELALRAAELGWLTPGRGPRPSGVAPGPETAHRG